MKHYRIHRSAPSLAFGFVSTCIHSCYQAFCYRKKRKIKNRGNEGRLSQVIIIYTNLMRSIALVSKFYEFANKN
jgi:hypothetical protein